MPADYQRVIDDIEQQITAGSLSPGDRLMSIVQLAARYDTSQTTVKSALAILRARGLVRGHQGKGVYVADPSAKA